MIDMGLKCALLLSLNLKLHPHNQTGKNFPRTPCCLPHLLQFLPIHHSNLPFGSYSFINDLIRNCMLLALSGIKRVLYAGALTAMDVREH